jgi:hypothetical protein
MFILLVPKQEVVRKKKPPGMPSFTRIVLGTGVCGLLYVDLQGVLPLEINSLAHC